MKPTETVRFLLVGEMWFSNVEEARDAFSSSGSLDESRKNYLVAQKITVVHFVDVEEVRRRVYNSTIGNLV